MSDVAHMDEVTRLPTVLEHSGSEAALVRAAEDAGDPGVRRVTRHSWPVHVVVAQRGHRRAGMLAFEGRTEILLSELRRRIHVARIEPVFLAHRLRTQRPTARRARRLEPAGIEIVGSARTRAHDPVLGAAVSPFAVDDHARRKADLSGEAMVMERAEEDCGAEIVARHVVGHVAEIDTESDFRSLMGHGVDTIENAVDLERGRIADIGPVVGRRVVQSGRNPVMRGGIQVVDDDHLVTETDEFVDDVRPDEPGPAGDQYLHRSTPVVRRIGGLTERRTTRTPRRWSTNRSGSTRCG